MGGRPPAPRVEYIPAPPPPVTVSTPTQSLQTQTELAKLTGEQTRLNMETGADLDRINEEFYTGQDLRRYRARGAEERLLSETRGEQERATIGTTGTETRRTRETEGAQTRQTRETEGAQERLTTQTRGQEQRATVGKTAEETRETNLQQEQFRRYKENRDFQQSRDAYKS
jgi:type IV secretory pathway VirB10-like protein